MDSIRDKSKPFCLFIHHKAPHRTWMPDLCDLDLYDDVIYPMPETSMINMKVEFLHPSRK